MGFIIGFSRKLKKHDSIVIVVDRLSKITHFIVEKYTNSVSEVAHIFMTKIVRLHSVPKKIISDKDAKVLEGVVCRFGNKVSLHYNLSYANRWINKEG